MAPPSTSNLQKLVEYQSKSERFEMFDGQGTLVLIVARFVIKLLSEDDEIIESLRRLEESAIVRWSYSHYSQEDRKFAESFWCFVEQLQVFFKVPNVTTTAESNELVAAFIDLLLEIIEEILNHQPYFIHHVKDSMKKLKIELKFLITFLGDTPSQPMELQATEKTLAAIEDVANEVGGFLYSFFFSKKRISMIEMKQKLDGLLEEVHKLEESIKIHCVTVATIPQNDTTQKPAVISRSLVDSVVAYLDDLMNGRDKMIVDLMDQIRTIHQDLMSLSPYFQDVEHSAQLGSIVYEIEYLLESFSPKWYLTLRIPYILKKIHLIRLSIQERNVENYDVGISASHEALLLAPGFSNFDDILVGRRDEVREIILMLHGGPTSLQVISICGMAGLGKTAIVRKIFNDSDIVNHFEKKAWCSISRTYQRRNVLIDILSHVSHINPEMMQKMEDYELADRVHKGLKMFRYLIVMDDIWNENVWHDLKRYLPNDHNGSRILLTSQHKDMAPITSLDNKIYFLRFLEDDECWDLLQLKVFNGWPCPRELEDVGREIARNCHGLPLAVVSIASILATMERTKTLWMAVPKYIINIIEKTKSIMELSYNRLPMCLRPCFLYFGLFKRGTEIPVQKLLILWDAEGFIGKEENTSSKNLAEEYLMDLISRSMVLVAKRGSDGRVKSCTIHAIMYDMCIRIAERQNFAKVIKDRLSIYQQHHRLSIDSNSIPSFSRPFGLHVRSLLGHLPDPSAFMFGSLKCLKVLDLPTIDLSLYSLTGSEFFGNLKFLSVSSIPSSIEIFRNLEFLFVDNKEVAEIPAILLNMVKLKHVHFSGSAQFSEAWHLEAAHTGKFQISYLQNISSLLIYEEHDEKILRFFAHLLTLKGRCTVFWDSSENCYRYPALNFFERLESLHLSFRPSYESDEIIPEFMSLPLNLRKLTLRNFDLSRNHMKQIGELPHLEVLKLQDDAIEGKQWETSDDSFIRLRHLELDAVQMEYWNASGDCFPILEHLLLVRCQLLKEIPFDFGYIPTLQKIEVYGCRTTVEASVRQIKKEQDERGNEGLQVIISDF